MRTLLFSAILYLTGIAVLLFFRPSLMFHADGRWKEFGTASPDHTAFPFWLFCIVWAIISYLVCLLLIGEYRAPKLNSSLMAPPMLEETEPPEDLLMPLPPKTRTRARNRGAVKEVAEGNMKPGYYVLDTKSLGRDGVPKYIYMGEEPAEFGDSE